MDRSGVAWAIHTLGTWVGDVATPYHVLNTPATVVYKGLVSWLLNSGCL